MSTHLTRVTQLTSPPVIGQRYLVPTVTYPWLSAEKPHAWPVFPNRHEDAEIIGFVHQHYHVDPRFLTNSDMRKVGNYYHYYSDDEVLQGVPLSRRGMPDHPPVVWRARTCQRGLSKRYFLTAKMQPHFVGRQCASSRHGWVCPHRNYPLGSIPTVDGAITCPLHGLRIDAASGVVLPVSVPA